MNTEIMPGKCVRCGAVLPAGAHFCGNCGAKVDERPAYVRPGVQLPPVPGSADIDNDCTELGERTHLNDRTLMMGGDFNATMPLGGDDRPQAGQGTIGPARQPGRAAGQRSQVSGNAPSGGNKKTIFWVVAGVILALGLGIGAWALFNKGHRHYDDDDDERTELADKVTPAEGYEYEAVAPAVEAVEATEAPAEEAAPSASDDFYVPSEQSNPDDDMLTWRKNFTRPDLTICDVHGRVRKMSLSEDGRVTELFEYDSDGNLVSSARSFKPWNVNRDDKGRIVSESVSGGTAYYNWSGGLLSGINYPGSGYTSLNYSGKGELVSDNNGNTYSNYVYDPYLNWVSRTRYSSSGTPYYQRRKILYY